jgi:hypothetical protein
VLFTYTVPASTSLPPGGFWVFGSGIVPNVNQVLGTTGLFDDANGANNAVALTLRNASGTVIDTLVYESNKNIHPLWNASLVEGPEGLWGNLQSGVSPALNHSWQRLSDGYDTNDNGRDFRVMPATPGATNNLPSLLPYAADLSPGPGQPLAGWGRTFQFPFVIDPLVASANNPNAIPAPPFGGNAAIFWDEVGGGNHNMLLTPAVTDVVIEAIVYFDATPEAAGEYETWSVGVQGTTDTFFNNPDPSGFLAATANGHTGVTWTYQVNSTGAVLYLIDHGDGGWGPNATTPAVVIGQIPVMVGVNDGWQRLRLQVSDNFAEGFFGGTLGQPNGTRVGGCIRGGPGGVYIGYREFVTLNPSTRAFTASLLTVRQPTTTARLLGTPTRNSAGLARICANSEPYMGNAGFGVAVSSALPSSAMAMLIDFPPLLPASIDLTIIGMQPGSRLHVAGDASVTLPTSGTGNALLPLPLPMDPALNGFRMGFQGFQIDLSITAPIPVSHTAGLEVTFGPF